MTAVELSQALETASDGIGEALLLVREDQWFDRKSARVSSRHHANALIGCTCEWATRHAA